MAAHQLPHFGVEIVVGGQPLDKIAGKDGKTWVIARFDHAGVTKMVECEEADPYGEKYTQQWPATPYAIRVTNYAYPGPVEAKCFVDGKLACKALVRKSGHRHGKDVRTLKGYQSKPESISYARDSVVEFLFTLPRIAPPGARGEENKV
mmetsp:Transcript_31609/g.50697  ORF Transcript_31609/g.50697 Transcript_31609/m.50697 type:complete len:149 (+) Transcript_31609:1-447(+)